MFKGRILIRNFFLLFLFFICYNTIVFFILNNGTKGVNIMEILWNIIIGVVTSSITALLVWYLGFRKMPEMMKAEIEKAMGKSGNLSNEHTSLSNEHTSLREEHKAINETIDNYLDSNKNDSIGNKVKFIFDDVIEKQIISKNGFDIDKKVSEISYNYLSIVNDKRKLNEQIIDLESKYNKLEEEITKLGKENNSLKEENNNFTHQSDRLEKDGKERER